MADYLLEDVFVTEGVPAHTFVRPPNYNEILVDVRRPGKPVIIEGQSGTGKTTTIKTIIGEIGERWNVSYLSARRPEDVEQIEAIAVNRPSGHFVIDDFHRLPEALRERLANIAKIAAEQEDAKLPKLIIIGINQVGSDLIQLVDDIAKRTGIHRIQPGTQEVIQQLVTAGCEKLNVKFNNTDLIFNESQGDYWLTQQLCQSACTAENVIETQKDLVPIEIDLDALRARVVGKLQGAYYPAVKEFCRGRRFRPSNDPYFKLLRTIGEQDSSVADLNELANAIPEVRGSINNIKEHRLRVLLDSKALCGKYFYYNRETKNFAIEDPALFYFVKHLDWAKLRADCGFREVEINREFDVAISFAGENRALAKHIAEELEFLDVHVFFDEYYEDNYLGRAWGDQFKQIFSENSDYVIVILDINHKNKIWPTFERDCFVDRVKAGEVIPIVLDDTKFVGILSDIVSIHYKWDEGSPDWKSEASEKIVFRLIDRLD